MPKPILRRVLTTLLALIIPLLTFAHDFEVEGIYYKILYGSNNSVAVTYRGNNYDSYSHEYTGIVTIPNTVTYNDISYSVTSIGDYAFRECTGLSSVNIPNSIIS